MADAALRLVVLAWLGAGAYFDLRFRRLPSWRWNALPLLAAGILSGLRGGWIAPLSVGAALLLPRALAPLSALGALADRRAVPILAAPLLREAWERGWMGGADVCAALVLLLVFPDAGTLAALALGLGMAALAFRLRGERRFPGLVGIFLAALIRATVDATSSGEIPMGLVKPIPIAIASRADGVEIHLARDLADGGHLVYALRPIGAWGVHEMVEMWSGPYEEVCVRFYDLANLDPVLPWAGLVYFNDLFREPDPEHLARRGFRRIKRPAGFPGRAQVFVVWERTREGWEPAAEWVVQTAGLRPSAEDLLEAMRRLGVGERFEIRWFAGDRMRVAAAVVRGGDLTAGRNRLS